MDERDVERVLGKILEWAEWYLRYYSPDPALDADDVAHVVFMKAWAKHGDGIADHANSYWKKCVRNYLIDAADRYRCRSLDLLAEVGRDPADAPLIVGADDVQIPDYREIVWLREYYAKPGPKAPADRVKAVRMRAAALKKIRRVRNLNEKPADHNARGLFA